MLDAKSVRQILEMTFEIPVSEQDANLVLARLNQLMGVEVCSPSVPCAQCVGREICNHDRTFPTLKDKAHEI
jgi:hypothetical protein